MTKQLPKTIYSILLMSQETTIRLARNKFTTMRLWWLCSALNIYQQSFFHISVKIRFWFWSVTRVLWVYTFIIRCWSLKNINRKYCQPKGNVSFKRQKKMVLCFAAQFTAVVCTHYDVKCGLMSGNINLAVLLLFTSRFQHIHPLE